MKIGLVGYQRSGKSSLFHWLTGVAADPSLSHTSQSAMAPVDDPRVAALSGIYHPKKVTLAALELVDTPGLSRTHEGNPARLALIREAGCLVHVVAAYDGSDPLADILNFQEDMILTDLEIVSGRLERLREAIQKPRPNRDELEAELHALEPLRAILEAGRTLTGVELTDEQARAIRSFGLLSRKPRLALVNTADDEADPERFLRDQTGGVPILAVPIGLESELARMDEHDREEFRAEMGGESYDRGHLIRKLMEASGQMLFFTAGEKEVRTWMIRQGATAVEAAGSIHTDMARGFIRAEIMTCDDLIRLGSEREVKAHHLVRQEPKDYIIQDDDILNIRFSV
jgi:ribosome-binding ATPase YchF (GTP1/OBG family)